MEKLTAADLEFIRLQSEYLNNIRKQIDNTGECKLSAADVRKIDMIAQSLNAIKFFLNEFK